MDPNRLTLKTQEALHDAQTKALRYGHTEVDTDHLLLALLEQPDGLAPRLLTRAEVDTGALRAALERTLESRPSVSGPGAADGQIGVTRSLAQLLDAAEPLFDAATMHHPLIPPAESCALTRCAQSRTASASLSPASCWCVSGRGPPGASSS